LASLFFSKSENFIAAFSIAELLSRFLGNQLLKGSGACRINDDIYNNLFCAKKNYVHGNP
jgi:hypothetical protein